MAISPLKRSRGNRGRRQFGELGRFGGPGNQNNLLSQLPPQVLQQLQQQVQQPLAPPVQPAITPDASIDPVQLEPAQPLPQIALPQLPQLPPQPVFDIQAQPAPRPAELPRRSVGAQAPISRPPVMQPPIMPPVATPNPGFGDPQVGAQAPILPPTTQPPILPQDEGIIKGQPVDLPQLPPKIMPSPPVEFGRDVMPRGSLDRFGNEVIPELQPPISRPPVMQPPIMPPTRPPIFSGGPNPFDVGDPFGGLVKNFDQFQPREPIVRPQPIDPIVEPKAAPTSRLSRDEIIQRMNGVSGGFRGAGGLGKADVLANRRSFR